MTSHDIRSNQNQKIKVNGAELCTEAFGDPADPAILLIMGGGASMDWWEDGFCQRLAAGPRFVIRYDHRDTGQSTSYPPGAPPYTRQDLVSDAVGVLDAFGLERAHIAGMSMGGDIGQTLALDHPGRVASLTLISTSPGPGDPDLPPMSGELSAYFSGAAAEPDWSDRTAVIDYMIEDARRYAAPSRSFDVQEARALMARVHDRTTDMAASMTNHFILEGGGHSREQLADVTAPTLVMHGTEDPLFPYGHGRALAAEIPGAQLIPLERTGHEFPATAWDIAVPAILSHTTPA